MRNPEQYNASGCKDLTPYEAIRNIEREGKSDDRIKKLLATVFYVIELAGFEVEGRIVLRDKKTGKVWR